MDQRGSLDIIESASESLLSAVNDLLDISEIETGGIDLQQIPFRLPDAVREAVRPVRSLAADRGIEVTLHGLSGLPTDVVGDPGRLRQVISRLADNAVRYTHAGRVQVGAGLVDHDHSQVTVRFAIRDTGVGIPPDEVERIFEPFSQGDAGGVVSAGLGLTISRAAVRAMGGDIRVASRPGQGSTFDFTLTFPRHVTDDQGRSVASVENRWVVIVGDRAVSNGALVETLRGGGLEPSDFTEIPLAAAAIALSDDPDSVPAAVIAVPTANPFAFAGKVLRDPQLSRAPLVLVPPQGQRGDGEQCIRLGIAGYLPQPLSPVDIIDAVRLLATASSPPPPLITRHSLRERRNPFRVLVVDDSPTGRALVMRGLDAVGHETAPAATGKEALEALRSAEFDVVLMDMEMPEMDGIEATRLIRASGSDIPIVGISAHAFNTDRQACLDAGMNEHIVKPFRIESVQMAMERLVNQS